MHNTRHPGIPGRLHMHVDALAPWLVAGIAPFLLCVLLAGLPGLALHPDAVRTTVVAAMKFTISDYM